MALAFVAFDEILTDLDLDVQEVATFGVVRHAVVGEVADEVGLVVADDETWSGRR